MPYNVTEVTGIKRHFTLLIGLVLLVALFVCAAIGEQWLRRAKSEPMSINGLPIAGINVSGTHMPDFLYEGRAWWIDFDTDRPLTLTLDDWTYRIPAGSNRVYSNHDHTNTDRYGGPEFWGFPDSVSIREDLP